MAQWIVIGYPSIGDEEDGKRLIVCEHKKGAVGAVGIMLDHFNMAHIDVMRDDKYGDHSLKEYKIKKHPAPTGKED